MFACLFRYMVATSTNKPWPCRPIALLPILLMPVGALLIPFGARSAEGRTPGTLTFVLENDWLGGTDRNYSNGLRLSWMSSGLPDGRQSTFFARTLLEPGEEATVRRGFALGHEFYTPEDIEAKEPLPDQHPYAAWLYGEYTNVVERPARFDRLSLQAGIVGPSAGGEWVQNEVHRLIGNDPARGWDNQIDDEPGIVLSYDRRVRAVASTGQNGYGYDITPDFGLSIGNVQTNARVGVTLRYGRYLDGDYGPPRIRPSLGGTDAFRTQSGRWYIFAGVQGRAVAHDIFVDGSLFGSAETSVTGEPEGAVEI